MRLLGRVLLCGVVAAGMALAQRGGGARGGGFGGGARGFSGGMRGGAIGGGFRGGSFGGFRGGVGFGGRFFSRGFYYGGLGYWPYFGFGYAGYGPYYDYAYPPYGYYNTYPYDYGYATYQPSPNVTVIYPQQPATVAVQPVRSVTRQYDQYGQEVGSNASPLYLIAFRDHTIRAAISYRVDGATLHYVTMQNENQEAPLDTVDRALSLQLNRERRIPFQLPQQQ